MITDFDSTFLNSGNFRSEAGSRRSPATYPKVAAHSLTTAPDYDSLLSGSAVFPAFVLRRAGLLDSVEESLTHYHE